MIGRDPKTNCLLVAVKEIGKVFRMPESVPNSVSRYVAEQNKAHLKIEIDDKGAITLYNLNGGNITYVDGNEAEKKRINHDSKIELGKDRYVLNLGTVMKEVMKYMPPIPMDISHLRGVFEKHAAEHARITRAQQEMAKKRMQPIIVSSASGILSAIGAAVFSVGTLWVTLPVTAVVSALYFRNYSTKDTSADDKRAADDEFYNNLVCPACGHSFNVTARNYELLIANLKDPRQNNKMYCRTCGCELIERT